MDRQDRQNGDVRRGMARVLLRRREQEVVGGCLGAVGAAPVRPPAARPGRSLPSVATGSPGVAVAVDPTVAVRLTCATRHLPGPGAVAVAAGRPRLATTRTRMPNRS